MKINMKAPDICSGGRYAEKNFYVLVLGGSGLRIIHP